MKSFLSRFLLGLLCLVPAASSAEPVTSVVVVQPMVRTSEWVHIPTVTRIMMKELNKLAPKGLKVLPPGDEGQHYIPTLTALSDLERAVKWLEMDPACDMVYEFKGETGRSSHMMIRGMDPLRHQLHFMRMVNPDKKVKRMKGRHRALRRMAQLAGQRVREDQAFELRMLEERGPWYRVIFLGAPKELVRKVQKAIKEQDEECKDACGGLVLDIRSTKQRKVLFTKVRKLTRELGPKHKFKVRTLTRLGMILSF